MGVPVPASRGLCLSGTFARPSPIIIALFLCVHDENKEQDHGFPSKQVRIGFPCLVLNSVGNWFIIDHYNVVRLFAKKIIGIILHRLDGYSLWLSICTYLWRHAYKLKQASLTRPFIEGATQKGQRKEHCLCIKQKQNISSQSLLRNPSTPKSSFQFVWNIANEMLKIFNFFFRVVTCWASWSRIPWPGIREPVRAWGKPGTFPPCSPPPRPEGPQPAPKGRPGTVTNKTFTWGGHF